MIMETKFEDTEQQNETYCLKSDTEKYTGSHSETQFRYLLTESSKAGLENEYRAQCYQGYGNYLHIVMSSHHIRKMAKFLNTPVWLCTMEIN